MCTTSIKDTSDEFATSFTSVVETTGVNDTSGKLPPVSTTPVANNRTISGCRYLKVNLKAKIYIYVNSTIQMYPNKIIKIFLIEDFFDTGVVVNL
jgi:hypothetical protein